MTSPMCVLCIGTTPVIAWGEPLPFTPYALRNPQPRSRRLCGVVPGFLQKSTPPTQPGQPRALISHSPPLLARAGPGQWLLLPLQARCPLTGTFGDRRWYRQGPQHWSTRSALAGSGAGVLAGFPSRKELSVCRQAASKVVVLWGGERESEGGREGERERESIS